MHQFENLSLLKEKKEERIFRSSPFLYHKDMEIVTLNKKNNCTNDELTGLIKSGKLTQSDMVVLDTLELFQYINKYCIETYILSETDIPEKYKKKDYKKSLHKMVKAGIVLRHQFAWNTGDDAENGNYFYSLSKGAHKYISKYRKKNKKFYGENDFSVPDSATILHMLILNQFHIHFMASYCKYVRQALFSHLLKIRNYSFMLDACYRINCRKLKKGYLDIALLVIRRNPGWEKEYIEKLALIYAAGEKYGSIDSPVVLVLCEDTMQIKEAFLFQQQNEQVRNIKTYFTTDLQTVREPILDYLSECAIIPDDKTNRYSNGYSDGSPLREDNISTPGQYSHSPLLVEITTKKLDIF